MVKAHPYRAAGALLAVMLVCLLVAVMIGQHDDGPRGGLPAWLGGTTWFALLAVALLLVVLTVYLVAADLQWRRERHDQLRPTT